MGGVSRATQGRPDITQWQAFWRGYLDAAPFILIIIPYSMLFGVVARDAGLDILQTISMTVIVIAGASQFTALALLQDNAPVLIALLVSLAVNLRMALYSAALVPYLGHARLGVRVLMAYLMVDQAFAVAVRTYEDNPEMSKSARVAYYFGCMMLVCPLWYASTIAGAVLGKAVPASWSFDFAVPVAFIAMLAPLLRSGPHIAAAFVSAVASLAFAWVPWSLGLIIAAICGILAGAQAELYLRRRAERGLA